jgi:hypothetical protein
MSLTLWSECEASRGPARRISADDPAHAIDERAHANWKPP